jgi:MoxR-like ATPase/Mg-chelatase subunit ChlD
MDRTALSPADLAGSVIGRERELELILAAVETGRDLLLEGPPGTTKTTILKAITAAWGIPLVLVEGNAELTPGRLIGHHDPARVMAEGYSEETFVPGPLISAMTGGGFLYFEEFNRAPEDTLNALLTAIADREVTVPRAGTFRAAPTFRLVGSMNPFDNVGTTRLSVSIKDRLCRMTISYQDAEAERRVVSLRCDADTDDALAARIVADAVAATRRTREHDAVTQGASVRGAIDLFLLADRLRAGRGIEDPASEAYRDTFFEAMLIALSGRLVVDQATGLTAEAILREIWESYFLLEPALAAPGTDEVELPVSSVIAKKKNRDGRRNPAAKRPKELSKAPELLASASGGGLAAVDRRGEGAGGPQPPCETSFGEEDGELDGAAGRAAVANAEVRRAAREIAARLAAEPPRSRRPPRGGGGEVLAAPYRGGGDEIDLDRTLDALAERRLLTSEEILVRERRRRRRGVVLAVDVSGSMRGERLRTAAATVGALSAELAHDDFAVIAFWSDAAALQRFGERAELEDLVDSLLGLKASGLTNVAFPLEVAAEELRALGDRERRVLLLSDCVHNAGPDPRGIAAALPRLDVLFDVSGERDAELAADLARIGRGLLAPIGDYRDVAPALSAMLSA